MKDTIWLHIGTHKTGSTALQRSLATYDDGTTRFARLGTPHHSAPMAILFRSRPEHNATLRQKGSAVPRPKRWPRRRGRGCWQSCKAKPGT